MTFRALAASAATLSLLAACSGNDVDNDLANTEARINELEAEVTATAERAADAARRTGDRAAAGTDRALREQPGLFLSERFDVVNSSGNTIGSVRIDDTESGVNVVLDVTAIPAGSHAIHFHEVGACDGPDFTSAGGHYNPSGVNHGFEADGERPHAGDMRNFDSPQSGVVQTTIENDRVTLAGRRDGLSPLKDADGTALIIHAGADDYRSQPSGDAGARIACAVID